LLNDQLTNSAGKGRYVWSRCDLAGHPAVDLDAAAEKTFSGFQKKKFEDFPYTESTTNLTGEAEHNGAASDHDEHSMHSDGAGYTPTRFSFSTTSSTLARGSSDTIIPDTIW